MSKAIQVYDDMKEKVVDIPEDEVENITDMMRVFTGIQEVGMPPTRKRFQKPTLFLGSCDLQYHSLRGVWIPTTQIRSQDHTTKALLVQKLKRFGNP